MIQEIIIHIIILMDKPLLVAFIIALSVQRALYKHTVRGPLAQSTIPSKLLPHTALPDSPQLLTPIPSPRTPVSCFGRRKPENNWERLSQRRSYPRPPHRQPSVAPVARPATPAP